MFVNVDLKPIPEFSGSHCFKEFKFYTNKKVSIGVNYHPYSYRGAMETTQFGKGPTLK